MINRFFKGIAKLIPGQADYLGLFRLYEDYLAKTGWNKSALLKKPVGGKGEPVPWLTLPAIAFLEERVSKDITVFEYGSGNSTLWFSKYCAEVVSVEHDKEWFNYVETSLNEQGNVDYRFRELAKDVYASDVVGGNKKYDIILIDGRNRVDCGKYAVSAVSKRGVIIWDNADRKQYQAGYDLLTDNGFRRLDFWGLTSGGHFLSSTAIFYKDGNCLGI